MCASLKVLRTRNSWNQLWLPSLQNRWVTKQTPFALLLNIRLQVLVNVISGGLTPSFTSKEAEEMGAKIISQCLTSPKLFSVLR